MVFVLGKTKYVNPLGAGFYQLGLELTEMVCAAEYAGLSQLRF